MARRKRRGRMDDERPLQPPPMPEPADSRAVRVLYVGCEGESTEPDYLAYLNERFGRGDGRGRRPFQIHPVCKNNGLIPSRVVAEVRSVAQEYETWALFDRDRHHDIPQAYEAAAEAGTEVCFSHPSFDLWLLLHFQASGGAQSGHSTIVHDKLRKADPAYRRFDKGNDKSVKGVRRTALHDKEVAAVDNARSLVSQCEHGGCKARNFQHGPVDPQWLPQSPKKWAARSGHAVDCPVLDRDPSTDVWRLLVSLEIVTV